MLATVTGVGILAWWIGYFDPETCKDDLQQAGWTSCESIAQTQNLALLFFVGTTLGAALFITIRNVIRRRREGESRPKRLTAR